MVDIRSAFNDGIKNKFLKSDKVVAVQKVKNMAKTELKVVEDREIEG
jgi:hypothetical protein